MSSFLIWTDGGHKEVDIIDHFTYFVGGAMHEFVTHEYQGSRRLAQYRTGWMVADNIPDDISVCKSHLDALEQKYGTRKMRQILSEQETINSHPLEKETNMSLEEALAKNTAAIEALTAAFAKVGSAVVAAPVASASGSEPLAVKSGDKMKEESAADRKARLKAEKDLFDAEQAHKKAAEAAKKPAFDYEKDVKPLFVKISTEKGRDKAIACLQRLGCSKSADLLPAQYEQAVQFANEVLNEGRDPEAGNDDI